MRRLAPAILLTIGGLATAAGAQSTESSDEPLPTHAAESGDEGVQANAVDGPTVHVPNTICQGKKIASIVVKGAKRVDPEDILATMKLRSGAVCSDLDATRDARKLWDMGFFDELSIEATPQGNALRLKVTVVERPAIREVRYEGNDGVSDEDIDEVMSLQQGAVLSRSKVRSQVTKIRDLYAEEGFFLATIKYELKPAPDDNRLIDVVFKIDEGQEVKVRRVDFIGNHDLPADELNEIMQTRETGFFSFLSSNDTFNQQFFDDDVTRLQAWYYDKGYLSMIVGKPRIELTPDRKYVDITIPVKEGPRYKIGEVTVVERNDEGEEIKTLKSEKKLRRSIALGKGDWFSRTKIAEGIQEITRVYRDKGFAKVDIAPGTNLQESARIVDVDIAIRRGPPVTVERINISGNSKTREQVIRREFRVNEGQLYNQTKVERARKFINQLGYFERVDISEAAGSTDDQMVINVEVSERPTGTFQVGAGFSSLESFLLTAQIQQQNLFGRGQSLSLNLQLSSIRQQIQLQFVEPWLFGTEWSLAVSAFKTIREFNFFRQNSTGGGLTLGHPVVDPRLRVFGQYQLEKVNISELRRSFGTAGASGQDQFARLPFANLFRDGYTSSVRFTLTWDDRDDRQFTTAGTYASYSMQFADPVLGSQNTFVRHTAFGRFYKKLFGPFVLKVNTELGLITSRDKLGVPGFERFFLGGIFNIRGFPLQSIGPKAGVPPSKDPNAPVPANGLPFGGNFQAFYNIEVEFPIIESVGIRGVLFHDGGNTWNLENNAVNCQVPVISNADRASRPCGLHPYIRTSWGFGLRWFSPLGPLRFEWGIPIRRRAGEEKIRFEFTIGNAGLRSRARPRERWL